MKKLFFFLILPCIFSACGPHIYKSDEFSSVAETHKTIAIIPALVSIELRPNQAKKMSPEEMHDKEKSTGYDVQDKMYSWLLRRQDKLNYRVRIQDVSETNALLKKANIGYEDLRAYSKKELAALLGVDAVMSTNIKMEKPMSEGAAIAVGAVTGFWGSTNAATINIDVHEHVNGDLIWKYDYTASGSSFSSATQLVDGLMRNASKKFPYKS